MLLEAGGFSQPCDSLKLEVASENHKWLAEACEGHFKACRGPESGSLVWENSLDDPESNEASGMWSQTSERAVRRAQITTHCAGDSSVGHNPQFGKHSSRELLRFFFCWAGHVSVIY